MDDVVYRVSMQVKLLSGEWIIHNTSVMSLESCKGFMTLNKNNPDVHDMHLQKANFERIEN